MVLLTDPRRPSLEGEEDSRITFSDNRTNLTLLPVLASDMTARACLRYAPLPSQESNNVGLG